MTTGAVPETLSIRTFGGLAVYQSEGASPLRFATHTAEALLVYLAWAGKPLGRDMLAELLWPERTQEQARTNLRVALYRLRAQVEPYLLVTRQSIDLNPSAAVHLDARQFDGYRAAGELAKAVELYRGDFLDGFYLDGSPAFEQWALLERGRLRNLALSAYERLIEQTASAGQLDAAIAYAQRLLQMDMLHEPAHRHLMRLFARTGQRSAALAQFESCRNLLVAELGVQPDDATTALYAQIRAQSQDFAFAGESTTEIRLPVPSSGDGDRDPGNSTEAIRNLPQRPLATSVEHHLPTRHRLPYRLTSFVGREQEVAQVAQLVRQARLVTLTGPGGCGKTSLAVETARWFADGQGLDKPGHLAPGAPSGFGDGVFLVEFLPLSDPGLLGQALLSALGVEANPARPELELLVEFVGERRLLLVLDNCEHLVDSVAHVVESLLRACPNLTILATSRERFNIPAEVVYDVPSLNFPKVEHLTHLERLQEFAAVRLFVERSRTVRPDFRLTAENAPAVAQICAQLDGIPLALELAAVAGVTFSAQEIAARLDAHFVLTSPGFRTADTRHRTLNDTVAWSYNLLPVDERRLLALLAVFVGGWTLEALETIRQAATDCVTLLRQLVQKSLVRVEQSHVTPDGRTRYHLLRAVRDYAMARLAEDAEEDAIRRRHFAYYARLGSEMGAAVCGPRHRQAMATLDADYHNIRAAMRYAADKPDLLDAFTRLASELPYYWHLCGHGRIVEGESWLLAALRMEQSLSPATRALLQAAMLNVQHGKIAYFDGGNIRPSAGGPLASAALDELIDTCLAQGETKSAALLMFAASQINTDRDLLSKALAYALRAGELFEALGDRREAGFARNLVAWIHFVQSDLQAAQALLTENLRSLERDGANWSLCEAYRLQFTIARRTGDERAAIDPLWKIVALAEREGFLLHVHNAYYELERHDAQATIANAETLLDRQRDAAVSGLLSLALHQLGRMYLNTQQYERARAALDEAIGIWRQNDLEAIHGASLQWSLIDRGQVARCFGDDEMAERCFDESIALFLATAYHSGATFPLLFRGHLRLTKSELDAALGDFTHALRIATASGDGWDPAIVREVEGVAEIMRLRGDMLQAGRVFAAVAVADPLCSEPSSQAHFNEVTDFKRIMACVPTYRQDPLFEAGWQEGQALTLDEAVALALEWSDRQRLDTKNTTG